MRGRLIAAGLVLASCLPAAAADVPAKDAAAIFKAAHYTLQGKEWHSDCGDPGTASYVPGAIETFEDINGDGRTDAVVTESSSYCYGDTGMGYSLVSKSKSGQWKLITSGTGVPRFLDSKGKDGWPDMEIGGPGFCFPVERWNGKEYKLAGHQYEGKACNPN